MHPSRDLTTTCTVLYIICSPSRSVKFDELFYSEFSIMVSPLCCVCLRSEGANPYLIPLGGSNTIGLWGYIEAFQELIAQVMIINVHA